MLLVGAVSHARHSQLRVLNVLSVEACPDPIIYEESHDILFAVQVAKSETLAYLTRGFSVHFYPMVGHEPVAALMSGTSRHPQILTVILRRQRQLITPHKRIHLLLLSQRVESIGPDFLSFLGAQVKSLINPHSLPIILKPLILLLHRLRHNPRISPNLILPRKSSPLNQPGLSDAGLGGDYFRGFCVGV